MVTNFKENISILSVLKNNLYLNGLFVSDELYRLLNSSTYYGYRTTTGVLMKLGGTLSKKEFMEVKDKNNISLLCDFSEMPFEEYLKYREYTTVAIKKASSINKNALKNSTYFMLEKDQNGKLYIIGQYVTKKQVFQIKFEDCGFFKQDNYKDEAVVLQAGGIRLRDSICGDNCISGCTFCDFGKGADKYIYNFLNTERKEYIIDLIKQSSHNSNVKTLFVTGGNPSLTDLNRWTDFLKESINTFKECVPNGCIDVMLTPRGFDKYVYNKTTRYNERTSNSLNAHNSHNTANLCCGQNLDVLEQQILSLGEDFHIVSCIMNNDILNK